MLAKSQIAYYLYKTYIRSTKERAIVSNKSFSLGSVNINPMPNAHFLNKVYLKTRVIKHLYDKKPAEEFDFIIDHIHDIVKNPDYVYKNKNLKRGHYVLIKIINNNHYFCSIETLKNCLVLITSFRIRRSDYLKNYELLWSRRCGNTPHRNDV